MLIDEYHRFITVRQHTDLYDFHVKQTENRIIVSHPRATKPLEFSTNDQLIDIWEVSIWGDNVQAYGVSEYADEWFSEVLGQKVQLVTFGEASSRPVKETWRLKDEEVSFADGYPYLIVSNESLQDISASSGFAPDSRRFRPNIVVEGAEPYEEFLWSRLQMGEVLFQGLKPCERCVVTTIDPETKERGKEPLQSPAGLHVEKRAIFGQHASLIKGGMIRVGDEVRVIDRKADPYAPL
jgi:uncharacterized protein YcbX